MSNIPFTDPSSSIPISHAYAPFVLAPFVVGHIYFFVDIRLLPPSYAHVAAAISTCRSPAPFVLMHLVYFLLFYLGFVLVSLSILRQICRLIIQWAASPTTVDVTRLTRSRCIPISPYFLLCPS